MRKPNRFEIVAAVFVLVVIALLAIDLGRAVQDYLAVNDAAREAGRRSAVAGPSIDSASAIRTINERLAEHGLDTMTATNTVSIRPNGWPGASDDSALVVEYRRE